MDSLCDAEAAAEGVYLRLWQYNELKNEKDRKKIPSVCLYTNGNKEE